MLLPAKVRLILETWLYWFSEMYRRSARCVFVPILPTLGHQYLNTSFSTLLAVNDFKLQSMCKLSKRQFEMHFEIGKLRYFYFDFGSWFGAEMVHQWWWRLNQRPCRPSGHHWDYCTGTQYSFTVTYSKIGYPQISFLFTYLTIRFRTWRRLKGTEKVTQQLPPGYMSQ